jgi:hypothetical protein
MADTAFQTRYRDEFIAGFEVRSSLLRAAVTTEHQEKGNAAVFLVADSGGATAKTRGVNGLIPSRANNLTQTTVTLQEWHDLVRITDFNVFASQGNQSAIMQSGTMAVINRKIDSDIIAQLDAATVTAGSAATASLAMVMKAKTVLGNAAVPVEEEDNMFGLISHAFDAYLMQIAAYTSSDYVEIKLLNGGFKRMKRWAGVNWIIHPSLTGVGTNAEKCYLFHKNAIGSAVDTKSIQSPVGYNEEQAYSWARCSLNTGTKLLQNSGVIRMVHDGSAYVGS